SADGKTVALGLVSNMVRLWDVATGKECFEQPTGHDASVNAVAFSPGGSMLLTGGANQHIHLWDAASGWHLRQLPGNSATTASFSPAGRRVVSKWRLTPRIRIWDVSTGKEVLTLAHAAGEEVPCAAFTPDGKTIVSASWTAETGTGALHAWDSLTG